MPNWCENNLIVEGKPEEVQRFLEACRGTDRWEGKYNIPFSFDALVPMPQKFIDGKNKNGQDDRWYEWAKTNWGTKWDLGETGTEIGMSSGNAYINFDTAWNPPTPWLAKVAPMFPSLKFTLEYWEPGMVFAGRVVHENGILVEDSSFEDKDLILFVQENFDEEYGFDEEE